jgi:hypothetical protein
MSVDSNIAAHDPNGCLYIDSPKPSPFYLSPNLIMATKASDPSDVYPGSNTTSVSVSWTASCTIPSELAVIFDLYIGDPTLPMIPGSTLGPLATSYPTPNGVSISAGQSNVATTVGPWDSSAIPHLSQPHHGCLLARVYPFGATPDTGDLTNYPANDQHYAQHNCTINTTDGQGMIIIPIRNGTLLKAPTMVSIHAVPDLEPSRATQDAILPSLHLIPAFKQVATAPLRKVDLDVSAFRSQPAPRLEEIQASIGNEARALIEDREAAVRKIGVTPVRTVLPSQFFTTFNFTADLTGATVGDAHFYDVTQVNAAGQTYGGIKVVIVVTPPPVLRAPTNVVAQVK